MVMRACITYVPPAPNVAGRVCACASTLNSPRAKLAGVPIVFSIHAENNGARIGDLAPEADAQPPRVGARRMRGGASNVKWWR